MVKQCKKCGNELVLRQSKKTAAQQKKAYYYTHYYYCASCNSLFHDDSFKVTNQQTPKIDFEIANTKEAREVHIWTDGACVHNGTPRARAAWAFVSGKTEKAGAVEGAQTNNRGEGYAIYYALLWAGEQGYTHVTIYTDSQITIHGVSKPPQKVIANREIFVGIAEIITKYNLEVTYKKVLGHSGDPNNDRVDKLANTTAQK